MVILTLTEKGGEPKQLSFDKNEATIGRVQGNDVVLPKGNVSKRHCRIYSQDGHFSVEDLKSTNGTYVNGRKITEPTVVSTADKVYVGDFIVRVDNATPAEVPTPPPPGNEAGSLSSALPRRPPVPPPRPTGTMRTLDEDREPSALKSRSSGRITLPPPPPPPPASKRETSRPRHDLLDEDVPPPSAADIDLDEESLSTAPPKLNVPPLRPAVPISNDDDDVPTSNRSRPPLAVPPPSRASAGSSEHPTWLRRLLDDEDVSAVYVSGETVESEQNGRRQSVDLSSAETRSLSETLRGIASRGVPRPAPDAPVVNVLLPDGARLVAVFPPAANEMCATIYRAAGGQKVLNDLVREDALSKEMQQILEACTGARRNVIVSGDRRAAEVVLQALANTISSRFRVVLIADRIAPPAEASGWMKLSTERHNPDLLAAAIALRPDYLVVDVAAATTAADVLQECAVGQEGVFVAMPARSATDALSRLQALASPVLGTGNAARELIASSFDLIVHAASLPGGGVRVLEIAEPRAESDGRLVAQPLLSWRSEDGHNGAGRFQPTNAPSRLAATLAAKGVRVPAGVLSAG